MLPILRRFPVSGRFGVLIGVDLVGRRLELRDGFRDELGHELRFEPRSWVLRSQQRLELVERWLGVKLVKQWLRLQLVEQRLGFLGQRLELGLRG